MSGAVFERQDPGLPGLRCWQAPRGEQGSRARLRVVRRNRRTPRCDSSGISNGLDACGGMLSEAAAWRRETAQWRAVAASTDFPPQAVQKRFEAKGHAITGTQRVQIKRWRLPWPEAIPPYSGAHGRGFRAGSGRRPTSLAAQADYNRGWAVVMRHAVTTNLPTARAVRPDGRPVQPVFVASNPWLSFRNLLQPCLRTRSRRQRRPPPAGRRWW